MGNSALPLLLLATMTPVFFWWFVLALLDDDFALGPLHWIVGGVMILIIVLRLMLPEVGADTVELFRVLILLTMFGHAIWAAHRSLGEDLVPARRTFSRAFSILTPIFGICIALAEGWAVYYSLPEGINFVQLAALIVFVAVFVSWLTSVRGDLFPAQSERHSPQYMASDQFDDPAVSKLQKLMREGAYRSSGLTIGGLANIAKMPEHRLRKLINQQLGYRNFSAFLNDHRIDEAKRLLADPEMADKQITAIAFDLGFSSLAPFNRAFRERTGTSPRDFRTGITSKN